MRTYTMINLKEFVHTSKEMNDEKGVITFGGLFSTQFLLLICYTREDGGGIPPEDMENC